MLVGVPPNPPEASGHRVQRLPCLRPRRYRSWALCAYSATTSESFSSSSERGPHKSAYYGWELNVPYIPDGLTGGGQAVTATIYRDNTTEKVIEDQVSRGFWADF